MSGSGSERAWCDLDGVRQPRSPGVLEVNRVYRGGRLSERAVAGDQPDRCFQKGARRWSEPSVFFTSQQLLAGEQLLLRNSYRPDDAKS